MMTDFSFFKSLQVILIKDILLYSVTNNNRTVLGIILRLN